METDPFNLLRYFGFRIVCALVSSSPTLLALMDYDAMQVLLTIVVLMLQLIACSVPSKYNCVRILVRSVSLWVHMFAGVWASTVGVCSGTDVLSTKCSREGGKAI